MAEEGMEPLSDCLVCGRPTDKAVLCDDCERRAVMTLRFTPEAVELRRRVADAVANNQAMWLGPNLLRLLLGQPADD